MILPTKFSVVEQYIVLKCYVRFGSLADIGQPIRDVRFAPESGHVQRPASRTPTLGLLFRRRLVEASLCQGARSPVAMQGYGRRLRGRRFSDLHLPSATRTPALPLLR